MRHLHFGALWFVGAIFLDLIGADQIHVAAAIVVGNVWLATSALERVPPRDAPYVPLRVRYGNRRTKVGWWLGGQREALALRLAPWLHSAAGSAKKEGPA